MRRPLVTVALLYVSGVVLADVRPLPLVWLFGGAFCLVVLSFVWERGRPLLLWPLLVLTGWTNLTFRTAILSPHDLRIKVENQTVLATIRGQLTETPYQRVFERGEVETWHTLAHVDVRQLRRDRGEWEPATGLLAVSTRGILPTNFFGGQTVEITGVLRPPKGPEVAGAFDYRTYLRRLGIYYQMQADSTNDWQLVPAASAPTAPPLSDRFCAWAQRTLALGLPVEDEPLRLLWTMTLGWKTGLRGDVAEPFMRSGTMHVFAISGLHIALIAGILVSLLRVMQVPRSVCGLVVIPLIWLYTGFTGWQASAIRSTVMMTIIIAGWALKRPSDLLNSLAAAAFIILIWDPQQIFQASFQLSFFVVLSLALFTPIFEKLIRRCFQPDPLLPAELRPRWQRWLATPLRWLAASLATSLAAWVGSIPLIAYYFNLFTPVSLIANLIVVPLSSAALAANLASLAVGAWFPAAAGLFNHSAWLWMLLMARVSQWCAEVPGGVFYVPTPSTLSFVFYYTALISLTAGWLTKPGVRRWALAGLAVLGIAWLVHGQASRVGARLTVIPLSGGHAVYCDAPGRDGELLVNCGSQFAAEFTLKPFLKSRGVNRLENLVLTHGDVRQIGGAELIDARFHARRILVGPQRFRSPTYRDLVEKSRAAPGRWRSVGRGDAIGAWRVLHPEATDRFPQADDGALVLLGEIQGHRILLLSDLGRPGQNALLARCPDLRAEIVIAGLPVRGEPVSDDLLRTVRPSLVIVADSEFPATRRAPPALRERLAASGATTFYTRDCSAMEIAFRAGRCELRAQNQRLWQSPSVGPSVGR